MTMTLTSKCQTAVNVSQPRPARLIDSPQKKFPGNRFDLTATTRRTGPSQPRRQSFCPRISQGRKSGLAVFCLMVFIVSGKFGKESNLIGVMGCTRLCRQNRAKSLINRVFTVINHCNGNGALNGRERLAAPSQQFFPAAGATPLCNGFALKPPLAMFRLVFFIVIGRAWQKIPPPLRANHTGLYRRNQAKPLT